jgi:hypothetical protein
VNEQLCFWLAVFKGSSGSGSLARASGSRSIFIEMSKRLRDEGNTEAPSSPLSRLLNQVDLQALEIEAQTANRFLAPALMEFIDQCKDQNTVSQLAGFGWKGNKFKTDVDLLAFGTFLKKSKYQVLEQLGKGAYSHVYKGRDTVTNEFIALKKEKYDQHCGLSSVAVREISILRSLDHENVLKLVADLILSSL